MTGPLELQRRNRGDGSHEVVVAFSATDTATIVVLNEHLDGPGFQAMLEVAHRRYLGAVNVREGLPR